MANYYSWGRSNYFQVKDAAAFEAWCKRWDGALEVIRGGDSGELHGLFFETIPGFRWAQEGEADLLSGYAEDWAEADFVAELADHLADGWVAVLMEVGHEKRRYLMGFATAVNSSKESITVDIWSIYEWVEQLGQHVTKAQY